MRSNVVELFQEEKIKQFHGNHCENLECFIICNKSFNLFTDIPELYYLFLAEATFLMYCFIIRFK